MNFTIHHCNFEIHIQFFQSCRLHRFCVDWEVSFWQSGSLADLPSILLSADFLPYHCLSVFGVSLVVEARAFISCRAFAISAPTRSTSWLCGLAVHGLDRLRSGLMVLLHPRVRWSAECTSKVLTSCPQTVWCTCVRHNAECTTKLLSFLPFKLFGCTCVRHNAEHSSKLLNRLALQTVWMYMCPS